MSIRRFFISLLAIISILLINSIEIEATSGYRYRKFEKGHEIRLGIGALDLYTLSKMISCGCADIYWDGGYFGDIEERMSKYAGPLVTTGTIQFSYNYRISRWFEFSLYSTYTGFFQKYRSALDSSVRERFSESVIGIMPNLRITWVNSPGFRFYSGFGLGLASVFTKDYFEAIPMININLFGFSFGRKIYGFMEYSVGSLGLISTGVGYKF